MDEGYEVRRTATTSPLISDQNPNKTREEGELSSSDNDEIPTASAAPSSAAASDREELGLEASPFESLGDTSVGRRLYTSNSGSLGELPSNTKARSNNQRSTQKNRAPFVPFVIRFSDDESGSDSEEPRQLKPSETKEITKGIKDNKKSLSFSAPKLHMPRQTPKHVSSAMPNRLSLSRTFTSSITNINKQTSKNSGHLSVDKISRSKNLCTSDRNLAGQDDGSYRTLNLGSSKLQDLRQQIEMREKELKLKSAKQNKGSESGSCRNYNVSDSEIDAPSKCRTVSADFTKFEVKEPDRKRIKFDEPHQIQKISDSPHHMPLLESGIFVQKESAEQEKQVDSLGVDISINGNSRHVDKLVYPSNSSEQTETVRNEELKHPDSQCKQIANRATSGCNLADSAKVREVRFDEKALEPSSVSVRKGHLETSDVILNDARLQNFLDTMDISQNNELNMEKLLEIEEMQDKELEEAQEHRHKCEVEERNALKAYRKAQRALIEANAKCSHLYRKREFCSAHLRSLMIENPTFLKSSTLQNGINSLVYAPEDVRDLPTSSHQMMDAFSSHNEKDNVLNINSVDDAIRSEPDDSISALQKRKRVNEGSLSPVTDLSSSSDEDDETFSFDEKSVDSNIERRMSPKVTNEKSSLVTSQDSLILEATLRSQLFARLGKKVSSENKGQTLNLEPAFEPRTEQNGDEGHTEMKKRKMSSPMKEKSHYSDAGNDGVENMQLEGNSHVENFCSNCASPAADLLESCLSSVGKQISKSFTFSCPILRSTFSYLMARNQESTLGLKKNNQEFNTYCINEGYNIGLPETRSNDLNMNSMDDTQFERSPINIFSEKASYYTSNITIDPFRPLCLFELRGKCNNDECPWQHIEDCSSKNINPENSEIIDSKVEFSRCGEKTCNLTPPTYIATSVRKFWQKCLSTSMVLSSWLTSEEPFLYGTDARVELHGSRNNGSLYFQRTLPTNQLDQQIDENDQILEVALLNLSQEVKKSKGRMEALKVLARSVEADPSRVIFWVAYLHIYHSADHFFVKDDMFSFAVELNQGSYELWLIYINTRMQLEDRFTAYNNGILALCRNGSAADSDAAHASACILDLFLQYLNFLCNFGDVSRAAEKIFEIFLSEKNSKSHDLLLSNILPCLTPSDKCIFWFCCIYFTVYKKLPDSIVQCFEFQKEFNELYWDSANLTVDEKLQADLLMEMAVDSLDLVLDSGTLENESAINAAHMFAINHIKCIAVLEGLDCSRKLLDNYIKIYPSCLELVLMSAQTKASNFGDLKFDAFENALKNWDKEVPGVQCIWNQYVNFALENGRFDFAKQLMDRWFNSVWQVGSLNFSNIDDVFGFINLSLYKSFINDKVESRLAIDEALQAASAENYKHCVKEHVSFLLSSGDVPDGELLNILKKYLIDPRGISTVQPLSRKFIEDIKKPRARMLFSKIFSDLSLDFSLVNLVLEVSYGPSLLPNLSSKLEDFVDIVEKIIDIAPANYRLAISVGKILNRDLKIAEVASAGVSFWATSLITNSLFQAIPIPPELNWIEAADILCNLTASQSVAESFYEKALKAYPFSIRLWKSFLDFSQVNGNTSSVIAAAKERGIIL